MAEKWLKVLMSIKLLRFEEFFKVEKFMKNFLERKFGEKIVSILYDKDQSNYEDEALTLKKEESQEILYKLNKIARKKIIEDEIIKKFTWAFDFPGYTGKFGARKYMVIGLEPHIEKRNFQKTYDIDIITSNYDTLAKRNCVGNCLNVGNSWKLWKRLIELTWSGPIYSRKDWDEFFSQFYITDLCHFAPKGEANKIIKEIGKSEWKKIRSNVAGQFLKEEILLVKPKFIITHGKEAAISVGEILKTFDKSMKLPQFNNVEEFMHECNGEKITHVAVGHLASGLVNGWWKNNKFKVEEKMKNLLEMY